MSARQDRPSVRSRAAIAVGVASLAVVAIAARLPGAQDPVVAPVTPAVAPADSTAQPDTMALMVDTAPVAVTMEVPAPQPAAPATWPVDPATGQTLINGVPVVGRVFIQSKVDGLVKIKDVATALAPEALPPAPAVVAPTHAPLPATAVRRQRNPMVQATLWGSDDKPSAVRNRHFKETTTGASLGQR